MPDFSQVSRVRLLTCDEALQRLFNEVIKERDCMIVCGFRNETDQNKAFDDGFSRKRWPDGAHNRLPSLAVDVLPAPYDWSDTEAFKDFGVFVKARAFELGMGKILIWGGDWSFKDYPHWEIRREAMVPIVPIKWTSTFATLGLQPVGVGA